MSSLGSLKNPELFLRAYCYGARVLSLPESVQLTNNKWVEALKLTSPELKSNWEVQLRLPLKGEMQRLFRIEQIESTDLVAKSQTRMQISLLLT